MIVDSAVLSQNATNGNKIVLITRIVEISKTKKLTVELVGKWTFLSLNKVQKLSIACQDTIIPQIISLRFMLPYFYHF